MKHLFHVRLWRGPLLGCAVGLLLNKHAAWVGLHYSRWNRRACLNVLPFVTIWLSLEGGTEP